MVSSSSINIRVKKRSTLWYGRYDRCLALRLKEAWVLRYNEHSSINKLVYNHKKWIEASGRGFDFLPEDQENLHLALDWKLANLDRVKTMVCGQFLYVYADNDMVLDEVSKLPGTRIDHISRIEFRGIPGTVSLRQSLYKNRTYFRWFKTTPEQKVVLRNLLTAQTDIKISPSFLGFLDEPKRSHVCDYYYIDHNDPGILYMLGLAAPGMIRKTVPITTYK